MIFNLCIHGRLCAFLSILAQGSFYLQVEGPEGWAFEPSTFSFEVNFFHGTPNKASANLPAIPQVTDNDDGCKEDIFFTFTGFSLSGVIGDLQNTDCSNPSR